MILLHVGRLLTNVSLDETLAMTFRKAYEELNTKTSIPRKSMKYLLLLCTKHVHFTFNR